MYSSHSPTQQTGVGRPDLRSQGSIEISAAFRTEFLEGGFPDAPSQLGLLQLKSNLVSLAPPLAYRIGDAGNFFRTGRSKLTQEEMLADRAIGAGLPGEWLHQIKAWLLEQTSQAPTELNQVLTEILADPAFSLLHHASGLLLVLAKTSTNQAVEGCCLAAENFLLAARDVGIATCWVGLSRPWFDLQSTKIELGLPEAHRVVAPIILGYPKAWPASPGRQSAEIHWMD